MGTAPAGAGEERAHRGFKGAFAHQPHGVHWLAHGNAVCEVVRGGAGHSAASPHRGREPCAGDSGRAPASHALRYLCAAVAAATVSAPTLPGPSICDGMTAGAADCADP